MGQYNKKLSKEDYRESVDWYISKYRLLDNIKTVEDSDDEVLYIDGNVLAEKSGDKVLQNLKEDSNLEPEYTVPNLYKVKDNFLLIKFLNNLTIISIEGKDRSGKTTVINKLRREFDLDENIYFKKFPDKTSPFGKLIYKLLNSDIEKFKAMYSTYQSKDKNCGIEELLLKGIGGVLIVDRFDVTQYVYGKSLGVEDPLNLLKYKSDAVIYIDIPVEETIRRGKRRGDNDLVEEDKELQYEIETYYEKYLEEVSKTIPVYKVDGLQSKDDLFHNIHKVILAEKLKYELR